jgi:hypothetical protein
MFFDNINASPIAMLSSEFSAAIGGRGCMTREILTDEERC